MWVDQVKFESKCTPRYWTVCSRDNASPLMRESGSWGKCFWDKRGIPHIKSCLWEVHGQHSRSQDEGGRHPTSLDQNISWKNYKAQNHQHTSAVCYDRMKGSQYAREKERLPAEHPHWCTGKKSTVVACWWNRKAIIELSKMELLGSRAYQGFVSVGWLTEFGYKDKCTTSP